MLKYICFIIAISGFAEETSPDESTDFDIAQVSEAMGHLIGKNLQSLGLSVDINAVVKGIKDASLGKSSPLSEDECVQAIAVLQEENLSVISEKNLEEAETFLQKNKQQPNVVNLEDGKLQYKIEKTGSGQSVQSYNSPIVQYKASYLNGRIFGVSDGDELLSLDDAIAGFSKGIVGMKEGEVRTLYIHPELGYGKQGQNSLLVFEVKVLKADASADAHAASNTEALPKLFSSDTLIEDPDEAR